MSGGLIVHYGLNEQMRRPILHILLICLLTLLAYSNTFQVPMHFDDSGYIFENPLIKDLGNFMNLKDAEKLDFSRNVRESLLTRYLVYVTFALNYKFHGIEVLGYHAVNTAVHIINAVLLYVFVILLFRTPYLSGSALSGEAPLIALFSALVFALHPLQTEAVTYITQRFTSMATMFYLSALVSYSAFRLAGGRKTTYAFYSLSLISTVLAMLSKEIAFTLPISIVLYEFVFHSGGIKGRIRRLVPFFISIVIIPLLLIEFGSPLSEAIAEASRATPLVTRQEYLLTQITVVVGYIRMLFLPVGQTLDHDWPIYSSLAEPRVLFSLAVILAIFSGAVYLLRFRRAEPALRLVSFGVFWLFIALSVESSVLPLDDLIFEHRVYLPSMGLIPAVVAGGFIIAKRQKAQRILIAILISAGLALGVATYIRNRVWQDHLILWSDAATKSPEKVRPRFNLGAIYANYDRRDEAIREFLIANTMDSGYPNLHYSLGLVYERNGELEDAQREYEAAVDISEARYNLGNIHLRRGNYRRAILEYSISQSLDKGFADAYEGMGNVYLKTGEPRAALENFYRAAALEPGNASYRYDIGLAREAMGQSDSAEWEYRTALELDPGHAGAYYRLGLIDLQRGDYDSALEWLRQAARLEPGNADYIRAILSAKTKAEEGRAP